MRTIRIGTRKSKLALLQTEIVSNEIKKIDSDINIEIVSMSTLGDKIQDISLLKMGGKGVFTKELEDALLEGYIDLAIHSAKDIPLEIKKGLAISPILKREDLSDVLISCADTKLIDLGKDKIIGTSSLRRSLQAQKINKNIQIKDLRGNIQTRINKLKSGEYDAIILASAGINRLNKYEENSDFKGLFFESLNPELFLPAPGQGILAVEYRKNHFESLINSLKNDETTKAFLLEREFLLNIGAACNAPCGIYTNIDKDIFNIKVMYANKKSEFYYDYISDNFEQALKKIKEKSSYFKYLNSKGK